MLARALRRARLAIFWERLWPALASIATAVGLFLALSWLGLWLALPPLGRADRSVGLFRPGGGGDGAAVPGALAVGDRGLAAARSQELAAAPAGHRHRRPHGARGRRPVRGRALARASGARAARGPRAEGRNTGAAGCRARSLCVARAGRHSGGRDVLCRRRRAHQTHRRGVRLARRGDAGQFPDRRLGHAAGLHRPAAADPAGPASRRAVACTRRRPGDRAGRLDLGGALDRPVRARRRRQRRHRRGQARRRSRRRPRAPRSAISPSPRPAPPPSRAAATTWSGPSTPSRIARRPSRSPRSRRRSCAARCCSNYKIEDDYGVVDAQATFERKPPHGQASAGRSQAAAPAVRRARISPWCCRRRARAPAPARPPRISRSIPGPAST